MSGYNKAAVVYFIDIEACIILVIVLTFHSTSHV